MPLLTALVGTTGHAVPEGAQAALCGTTITTTTTKPWPGDTAEGARRRDDAEMKYDETRSALDRFDWLSEPNDRGDIKRLPAEYDSVHCIIPARTSKNPFARPRSEWPANHPAFPSFPLPRAACGRFVKVVLPMSFDDSDGDACRRCGEEVGKWAGDPEAWWADRSRQEEAREARDEGRLDIAHWQSEQEHPRWEE